MCGRESQEAARELTPNSGRPDVKGRIWRKAGGQSLVRVDSRPAVGQALLTLGLQKWASLLESIAHESEEKKR